MYNDGISIIDASANHLGSSEDQLIIGIVNTQLLVQSFCHLTLPFSPPHKWCWGHGAKRSGKKKKERKKGKEKPWTERLLSGPDPHVGEEDQMQLPPWQHVVKPVVPEGRRDGEQPGSLRRAQIIKSSDCRAGHIKKLIGLHVAPCCGHPWAKSCLDASRQLRQIVWLKIRLEHCQCPCLEAPLKNEGTCVWEPRLGRELLMNNVPALVARTHSSFQLLEKTKPLKPEFTTFHWSSIWLELQDASPQAKFVSVKICFLLK